jgi:predicted lipoprotein with Yx(FWY)xxD motif
MEGGVAMRFRTLRLLPLVAALVAVGAAVAASAALQTTSGTVKVANSKSFGPILVAANNHTLYRYTPDKKGLSVCSGACLKFWPPLLLKAGAKPTAGSGASNALLGTIKTTHGMEQVTYAGYPLYYFAADTKTAQAKGQGYQNKWYVVNAKGAMIKHTAAAGAATTTTNAGATTTTGSGGWG